MYLGPGRGHLWELSWLMFVSLTGAAGTPEKLLIDDFA